MQIISLMRAQPLSEDDSLGKAALFTKYIQALPHALDSWKARGLGLVTNLLSGIQKAVQVNTPVHQNIFRLTPDALSQSTSASMFDNLSCEWTCIVLSA